jgi:iodotyrosine deiodinase
MAETKLINEYPFIRYEKETYEKDEMIHRSKDFFEWMSKRRSVRDFSNKPVPKEVIENIIKTASLAPSGANRQPWTFCAVNDFSLKKIIRIAAEEEEYDSYNSRMSDEWLKDLAPLQTDWRKPFLETAPYLIVVFRRSYEFEEQHKHQNYYVTESCGIACGFLLAAIHNAGLDALTHTPSPINFLARILKRPQNEKPFLLIPVGYPADDCWVPDIRRKNFDEMCVWYDQQL